MVGETVLPGMIGVWWLGDASRPGFAWLAVTGFVLAVSGAVAVAWFGAPENAGKDAPAPTDPPPRTPRLPKTEPLSIGDRRGGCRSLSSPRRFEPYVRFSRIRLSDIVHRLA